jgi:hypothetical protein
VGPGLFPASAANEAADDTSGQWPHAAARLSSGTMPQISTRRVFLNFKRQLLICAVTQISRAEEYNTFCAQTNIDLLTCCSKPRLISVAEKSCQSPREALPFPYNNLCHFIA